jgi:hypothetical protein
VLSSRVHGAVFVHFADFLDALCAAPDVKLLLDSRRRSSTVS